MFSSIFGAKKEEEIAKPPVELEIQPPYDLTVEQQAPSGQQEQPLQIPPLYSQRRSYHPGRFDEISKECKVVINQQEAFEGIRLETQKVFEEFLSVSHMLSLGSTTEPPSYALATGYATPPFMVTSRLDADGTLNGRVNWDKGKLSIQGGFMISGEPHQSNLNATVEYSGRDYNSQLKWQNPNTFVVSHMQSLTKTFAIGCEIFSSIKQSAHNLTLGARLEEGSSVTSIALVPSGMLNASYVQRISPGLHLATELVMQRSPRGVDSSVSWGADFKGRAAGYKLNTDLTGRLTAIYEEALSQNSKLSVSVETDLFQRKHRFGIALQLGG